MSINLVKGQKIIIAKEESLLKLRVGLGWDSAKESSRKRTIQETKEKPKKKGFLNALGSMLKGEVRIGDVVNSAVDSTRGLVNDILDEDIRPQSSYDYSNCNQLNIDIDASVILLSNDKYISEENLIYFGHRSHSSGSVKHMGDNTTGEGKGDDETIYTDLSKIPKDINRLVYIVNIFRSQEKHQHFGMISNAYIKIYDDSKNEVLCQYNLTDKYDGYTGIYVGELYRYNGEWKFNALGEPSKATNINSMVQQYR